MPRNPISKKIRFDVFKRDEFACQYCGKSPPSVVLEVDHIFPVSKGGENDKDNLITACFDCNRGKGSGLVEERDLPVEEMAKRLREKEDQLQAYRKLKRRIKARSVKAVADIEKVFTEKFPESQFTSETRDSIRLQFLSELDATDVEDYMRMSCARTYLPDALSVYKYFCGVCWRRIKGDRVGYGS